MQHAFNSKIFQLIILYSRFVFYNLLYVYVNRQKLCVINVSWISQRFARNNIFSRKLSYN